MTLQPLRSPLPGQFKGAPGKRYAIVAGVIRNPAANTGWALIESNHAAINIDSVTEDAAGIDINYATLGAQNVVTFIVAPDETAAADGITCGASVGLTLSRIKLTKFTRVGGYFAWNGSAWTTAGDLTGITYNSTSGEITIEHPAVPGIEASIQCRNGVYLASPNSLGSTTTKMFVKDYSGATVTGTPTTNHRFYVSRGSHIESIAPDEYASDEANVWFYGLFEV